MRWWEFRRRREVAELLDETRQSVVYVDAALIEEAVALVAPDLVSTLGWDIDHAEEVARAEAESKSRVDCWEVDAEVEFPAAVAEEVHQVLHDTPEDITWPRCPVHDRHPPCLVPEDSSLPTWRCPADGSGYGRLGNLTNQLGR